MTHPLDDRFGISDEMLMDDDYNGLIIPDDPNLDTIIDFALKAYKQQMDDIVHIEPKNRARYLEVSEKFLDQDKDAIDKKERIALQKKRLEGKKEPAVSPSTPVSGETAKEEPKEELIDRSELRNRIIKAVS